MFILENPKDHWGYPHDESESPAFGMYPANPTTDPWEARPCHCQIDNKHWRKASRRARNESWPLMASSIICKAM